MIWVIGSKGMLGQELTKALTQQNMNFVESDKEVDIRDTAALEAFVVDKNISEIVNCSAYTAVDKAEVEQDLAASINATGAGNIAKTADKLGARMIQISTDYVFGGTGIKAPDGTFRPYREDDPVAPQGVYANTKAEGETLAIKNCSKAYVLRTAWLYGEFGPNFISTMLRLMSERDNLGVVSDQHGTPTWTRDLVSVIIAILKNRNLDPGIYHATGSGSTTWYEFATEIYKTARRIGLLSKNLVINALSTDQYPTKAKRPGWSVLSGEKVKSKIGVTMPDWKSSLVAYLSELKASSEHKS